MAINLQKSQDRVKTVIEQDISEKEYYDHLVKTHKTIVNHLTWENYNSYSKEQLLQLKDEFETSINKYVSKIDEQFANFNY